MTTSKARRQTRKHRSVFLGHTPLKSSEHKVTGREVTLLGEPFYRIGHVDQMTPFFMTIVSDSDHWAFLSSTGGMTAGRVNAGQAIFPYYTDDKIRDSVDLSGGKSVFRIRRGGRESLWEPFSPRSEGVYRSERNLYKSVVGNAVVFEEINRDLGLVFRSAWRSSDRYGWIRTVWMRNAGSSPCLCRVLDGLLNILPWGVNPATQNAYSTLLDAYKRCELDPKTGVALYALSSILTDGTEPREALKATVVWQEGLKSPRYALSPMAFDVFRRGGNVVTETDVRGIRGAYLVQSEFELSAGGERDWSVAADVAMDHSAIVAMKHEVRGSSAALHQRLMADIRRGTNALTALVAQVDGQQSTADRMVVSHHFSNTLFNAMRGGTFAAGYLISRKDLCGYVAAMNKPVFERNRRFFDSLPDSITVQSLLIMAMESRSRDVERLCGQYLPLSFSRRHGDPSRPWNAFSIRIRKPDGTRDLQYEGNWRDIFQNWEALGYTYPGYIEGFVRTFLSATTADGYNPYRISNQGVDWEKPEPHDPWANIGYWSDHQIIYLLKLLEALEAFSPGRLSALLEHRVFSHANVPYRIKDYAALLCNARSTIEFDAEAEHQIAGRIRAVGGDGRLVFDRRRKVLHVNLMEKALILLLAKLANFVPEGGIWMNTQRPEWNDANNALVGKGLSMVTVCYLRRFVVFLSDLLARHEDDSFDVTEEVAHWCDSIDDALRSSRGRLSKGFSDASRRRLMDNLGEAGSAYRKRFYEHGLSGRYRKLSCREVRDFLALVRCYLEQTIRMNRRAEGLYHSYNILHLGPGYATVGRLSEMLEGQVAVLSSGLLTPVEVSRLLNSLRSGPLYRADQDSYMLYPNRLPKTFVERNRITPEAVSRSTLLARLISDADRGLVIRDEDGHSHFNGEFQCEHDLIVALDALKSDSRYADLVERERRKVVEIFEQTFNHSSFTGRANSFFAYEGIGSIYWHMVSKLLLAVQENYVRAVSRKARHELSKHYYEIRKGLGFNKSPGVYGAFPSDPYSHTPWGNGARQPGMTGQVKEELLTRLGEVGVVIRQGRLMFDPSLLRPQEWLGKSERFSYQPVAGNEAAVMTVPKDALAFTFCQTPVVLRRGRKAVITIRYANGFERIISGNVCDRETSRHVFDRTGHVREIIVDVSGGDHGKYSQETRRAR